VHCFTKFIKFSTEDNEEGGSFIVRAPFFETSKLASLNGSGLILSAVELVAIDIS
jgi:hypothetical protein